MGFPCPSPGNCLWNLYASGSNWARWLAVVWIAYHVILSGFHSLNELAVHGALLAAFANVALSPEATRYFGGVKTEPGSGTIQ